jgi:hypothetical protein
VIYAHAGGASRPTADHARRTANLNGWVDPDALNSAGIDVEDAAKTLLDAARLSKSPYQMQGEKKGVDIDW